MWKWLRKFYERRPRICTPNPILGKPLVLSVEARSEPVFTCTKRNKEKKVKDIFTPSDFFDVPGSGGAQQAAASEIANRKLIQITKLSPIVYMDLHEKKDPTRPQDDVSFVQQNNHTHKARLIYMEEIQKAVSVKSIDDMLWKLENGVLIKEQQIIDLLKLIRAYGVINDVQPQPQEEHQIKAKEGPAAGPMLV